MRAPPDLGAAVSPYIPALDGIRALAILLVIPHNINVLKPPYSLAMLPFVTAMHAGWIGVQLFFVLSGFLITGNLLDTRGANNYYSAFIARRALRILPLYFGVLLVALVLVPLIMTPPQELRESLPNQVWLWTFLSNWTAPYGGTVTGFSHFWSLAVEEQFYLLWPFVVARCRPVPLLKVCGAIVLAAIATRLIMLHAHASDDALYMVTPARMDALALGSAAAALLRIPRAYALLRGLAVWLAAAGLAVLLIDFPLTDGLISFDPAAQAYGYTLLALAFALIILALALPASAVLRAASSCLSWAPLRLVGRYSYGMYIYHLPFHVYVGNGILHRLIPHLSNGIGLSYSLFSIVASFALAAASYELYEKHFLRLKRLFMPRSA